MRRISMLVFATMLVSGEAFAAAHWGSMSTTRCTAMNTNTVSAQILDVPWGQSWESACWNTPAVIEGVFREHPTRCRNMIFSMWGEWDVTDTSCPHWSTIARNECTAMGVRKFSAQILDVPSGVSWEAACASEPATIEGQFFASPSRCNNMVVGEWGEWDVSDTSCPHWESVTPNECLYPAQREYQATLVDIPSGVSWDAACQATPATINGQHFDHPDLCFQQWFTQYGLFAVSDLDCPYCGNGTCDEWPINEAFWDEETCAECPADCGACPPPPACGDGTCNGAETPSNCSTDCGTCGNGTCNVTTETCSNCAADCGACSLTCSGATAGPSATVYRIGVEDPLSKCALAMSFFLANTLSEAETCGQNQFLGTQTIIVNPVPTQGWFNDGRIYGCIEYYPTAFSSDKLLDCATYNGYPYPGECW